MSAYTRQLLGEGLTFSSDTFYHGSKLRFEQLELSRLRTGADSNGKSWYGDGVYLTGVPWKAEMYGNAGYVYLVRCSVSNPFVIPGTSSVELTPAIADGLGIPEQDADELWHDSRELTKTLVDHGYDCIAVLTDDKPSVNELVVFDSKTCAIVSSTPVGEFDKLNRALKWPTVNYKGKRPHSHGW